MFICTFALSGAAAFYSIVGLMAIFAASPIPIAIMGSTLEVSKLVVASWLYRNWKEVPLLLKSYLTGALVVLMFLTSMGIFGFLSKAHLDQGVPTGDVAAKVAIIDEKIKTERENINAARQTLTQLDQQVNETLSRTRNDTTNAGVNRSVTIRQQQTKERAALAKQIEASQKTIAALNEERAPIAAELRKVEVEVGPIKYIAALIYGDEATQDATFLEKAVRWVTILIVAVFDPLAVVMLIAANWTLLNSRQKISVIEDKVELSPIADKEEPPAPSQKESVFPNKNLRFRGRYKCAQQKAEDQNKEPSIVTEPVAEPDPSKEHPVFQPESDYWISRPHRKPKK